jgi:superfamily II DNA or RNA helicase
VIVDECHQIMAKGSYTSLNFLKPRYVLALSATPYRPDGLNNLISLYFGTNQIRRELSRTHQVYRLVSDTTPQTKLNMQGKLDWNSVLNSISQNEERNNKIVELCTWLDKRATLILTKRIQQAEYLSEKLEAKSITVCRMYGKYSRKNSKAQVLIGTSSKIGVGFDEARLDCLIVACDIDEYFIQYLGRVFRRTDSEPIVIDIVDNHSVLKKHWTNRSRVYRKHGGIIKKFTWDTLQNHLNAKIK